ALSAVLVANLIPATDAGRRALVGARPSTEKSGDAARYSPLQIGLQRSLIVVALAVGPATMDLPSAMHLYWIASAGVTLLQRKALNHFMPIPKPTPPCTGVEPPVIIPRTP